jgi:hypothetical protein
MASPWSALYLGRHGRRALSLYVFALPFSLLASALRVLDLEPCPGEMLPPVVPSSPGNATALGVHRRRHMLRTWLHLAYHSVVAFVVSIAPP